MKVHELIKQLSEQDENATVVISGVGINSTDSWDLPLTFAELTVQKYRKVVRINVDIHQHEYIHEAGTT